MYDLLMPPDPQELIRLTVNLTSRSVDALNLTTQLTGDSKTDITNQALRVYSRMVQVIQQGGFVYIRETPDAQPEKVVFL